MQNRTSGVQIKLTGKQMAACVSAFVAGGVWLTAIHSDVAVLKSESSQTKTVMQEIKSELSTIKDRCIFGTRTKLTTSVGD